MSVITSRSILGNTIKAAKRRGQEPGTDPAVLDARRSLAAAKISEYIVKVVADAPALSQEQLSRLRALFVASPPVPAGDSASSPDPASQRDFKERGVSG